MRKPYYRGNKPQNKYWKCNTCGACFRDMTDATKQDVHFAKAPKPYWHGGYTRVH